MDNRRTLLPLLSGLVLLTMAFPAQAQFLQVWPSRPLDFGNVLPGESVAVTPADPGSARWVVLGVSGAEVDISFAALPTVLTQGAQTLQVTYDANSAAYATRGTGQIVFDPNAGTLAVLQGFFLGVLRVWLGGTAITQPTTAQGLYDNTITLDVVYTGN